MSLADDLTALGVTEEMVNEVTGSITDTPEPLWEGPTNNTYNAGVTFSLLSKYLVCRERFRILTIEGLQPINKFNHRLEYGNMWHLCEEIYARHKQIAPALINLLGYCQQLSKRYPMNRDEIDKWYNVCRIQFPIYVEYYKKQNQSIEETTLMEEQVFNHPYELSSRRVVYLRGKWDSVGLVTEKGQYGDVDSIKLKENKTKGEVDKQRITKQLSFDLQTMIYLITLESYLKSPDCPFECDGGMPELSGVIYNVVRRPLSGGRGNIIQKKGSKNIPPETSEAYYNRLKSVIDGTGEYETKPEDFFIRWTVDVDKDDRTKFEVTCLEPILENLCDDYEWWEYCHKTGTTEYCSSIRNKLFPYHTQRHYVQPFGVWNPLTEDGGTVYDDYIRSGSTLGLERGTNLFPELQT